MSAVLTSAPVKPSLRHGIAFGASLMLHCSVAVPIWLGMWVQLDWPELDVELIEVQLLDPDAIQAANANDIEAPPETTPPAEENTPDDNDVTEQSAQEEPKAPPKLPPEPPSDIDDKPTEPPNIDSDPDPAKKTDPPPTKPARALGQRRSRVAQLGPETSKFHILLVTRKVRRMPYAENVMDIMASFPDFEYLVNDGGFDPLHDFDHILISTPNITDPTMTFLVVDYQMDRDLIRQAIDRAARARDETIEWIDERGVLRGNPTPIDPTRPDLDPRFFVLPKEQKIAAYIREAFVPGLMQPESEDVDTTTQYIAKLSKLRRFAARVPTAGLQAVITDIRQQVRSSSGSMPLPTEVEFTIEATRKPEFHLRMDFPTAREAEAATIELDSKLVQRYRSSALVGWLVDLIEIERKDRVVTLWGQFTTGQLDLLLPMVASQVAKVQHRGDAHVRASRVQRALNWKQRQGGELPPSALDSLESPPENPALQPPSRERPPSGLDSLQPEADQQPK